MVINVSGSISAINKVRKSLKNLSPIVQNGLELHITSGKSSVDLTHSQNEINIGLINQDATDEFYQKLNGLSDSLAITLVDNGSGDSLPELITNSNLITRVLGLQIHCFKGVQIELSEDRIFRLNKIRTNPDISEIVLRTSDIAVFNMNAIRRADQCGNIKANTTGLTIEEACQIAKFIGASDLIDNIFFAGINVNDDLHEMMSINVANLIWYINEGATMRNLDRDISNTENLVFSVVAEPLEQELQFVKSTDSGRWWVKVPTEEGHMHMACSKRDYEKACNNEISDRISKALKTVV